MLNSLARYAVSILKPIDEGRTTDRVAYYLEPRPPRAGIGGRARASSEMVVVKEHTRLCNFAGFWHELPYR